MKIIRVDQVYSKFKRFVHLLDYFGSELIAFYIEIGFSNCCTRPERQVFITTLPAAEVIRAIPYRPTRLVLFPFFLYIFRSPHSRPFC